MSFLSLVLACFLVTSAPLDEVEAGFVPMFDGKTLEGWKQVGGAQNTASRGRDRRHGRPVDEGQRLPADREDLRRLHPQA